MSSCGWQCFTFALYAPQVLPIRLRLLNPLLTNCTCSHCLLPCVFSYSSPFFSPNPVSVFIFGSLYAFPPPPSGPQFLILFDHFALSYHPLPFLPIVRPPARRLSLDNQTTPNQSTNQPTEAKKNYVTGRDTPFLIGWPFVVPRCTQFLCPTMSICRQIMRPRFILIHLSMRLPWVALVLKLHLCWFT